MYETAWQIIIVLCSLGASAGLVFLPEWTKTRFTLPEQVILTLILFSVFILLDLCVLVAKRLRLETKTVKLWQLRDIGDMEFASARASFFKIVDNSYGDRDLFVGHFIKKIRELEQEIREAAEKRELYVQADHFLSAKNILDAFSGSEERVVRWTWPVNKSEKLFDDLPWKHFFERTAQMVQAGNIKSIKTIFIVNDSEDMSSPRILKLLAFFKTNKDMQCRIILARDYQYVCRDNNVPTSYQDFGIYGNHLLYRTYQEAKGIFSKNPQAIENYVRLFETMWTSIGITRDNPSSQTTNVTIEELFSFDQEES